MPRYKPRIQAGPKLSHDAHDKLMACLHWYYGKFKSDPDYVRAPHYFDAVYQWFQKLSLDDTERVESTSSNKPTSRCAAGKRAASLWR
jgi:hypothetical protein